MNKTFIHVLAVLLMFALAGTVLAVGPGKTVELSGKGAGEVTFDGGSHAKSGLKCNDCHPALFKMKKGADPITMKDMSAGKYCGACHNGTKAFDTKDPANCAKCHKK